MFENIVHGLADWVPSISIVVNHNSDNTTDFHNIPEIFLTYWSVLY